MGGAAMNCMKCGQETTGQNVFCEECLAVMGKYPVRPDAAVKLPKSREPSVAKKAPKRHVPTPEEQIKILRKRLRILTIVLIVCIAAIVLMIKPTLHYVLDEHVEIGQNYSTVVSTVAPTASQDAK